ncbi:MAG: Hsp20/alpha crystallin family protein [Spirochaetales bacterium]|nr:Hsp20/alpha crystallin family protein [Spirochaetales bacterium]
MKDKFVFDLSRIMDEIFDAAQDFSDAFQDEFFKETRGFRHHFNWDENIDYYPAYSYPPANAYINKDKVLFFEFALAGFDEKAIDLEFRGDYMILTAKIREEEKENLDEVKYFKRRLKYKNIEGQKYYAPESKFDRAMVKATFKNGILKVMIPPKKVVETEEGVKINIETEKEAE